MPQIITIPEQLVLPEWTKKRRLYIIMAGMELAAYQTERLTWMVKTGRCNSCGLCCEDHNGTKHLPVDEHGACIHLRTEGTEKVCDFGLQRPFSCSISPGRGRIADEDCTECFEEVE